jgi:hypothetical protein
METAVDAAVAPTPIQENPVGLRSISDVARELGLDRRVVSWIIATHAIATRPIPTNGLAKGLDEAAVAEIRRAVAAQNRN